MTSPNDIFDDYLSRGPRRDLVRLNIQQLHQSDRKHLAEFEACLQALIGSARQRSPLPRVNFYWLDEIDLDGTAFKHQNELFIGLTYGVVQSSSKLFNSMLSWPQVLPSVGNPLLETAPAQPFQPPRWGRIKEDHRIETIRSACPLRAAYARHLENLVVEQFMFHEFTHIMHGHAGYFDAHRGEPENVLAIRTTEMDADIGALTTQMHNIVTRVRGRNALPDKFHPFYENVAGSVFDMTFALATIFHIFGNYMSVKPVRNPSEHANTIFRLRLRMVIEWVMKYVDQFIGIEHYEPCAQAMLDGIEQARTAYSLVADEPRPTEPLNLRAEDPEWDHLFELTNYWRSTFRSALERFAYRELPRY
jgi:hypothetical protein